MNGNRFTMPDGGLIKVPRPADRETRFPAPSAALTIRNKEDENR